MLLVLGTICIQDVSDLTVFWLIAVIVGGVVVPFGLGMATYAQRKIDRMVVGHGGKQ